jgi:hypothetical protein
MYYTFLKGGCAVNDSVEVRERERVCVGEAAAA